MIRLFLDLDGTLAKFNSKKNALKRFDKMAKIAYSTARLIPGEVGLATDIIDSGKNIYNIFKNGNGGAAARLSGWLCPGHLRQPIQPLLPPGRKL